MFYLYNIMKKHFTIRDMQIYLQFSLHMLRLARVNYAVMS